MSSEWVKAVEAGDIAKLQALLNQGQEIDSPLTSGRDTALMRSLAYRRYEAAAFLLAQGADLNLADYWGWTGATYAVFAATGRGVQYGRCVPVNAPDPRFRDLIEKYGGAYLLRDAIILNDVDLVRALCRKSPETIDGESGTSMHGINLMLAAQMGNTEIIDALLDHGAEIGATDDIGRSALHTAAAEGCRAVVERLLSRGADVNDGWPCDTPLSTAEEGGHDEIAAILLNHGAKQRLVDALRLRDSRLLVDVLLLGDRPDGSIFDMDRPEGDRILRPIFLAIEGDLPEFVSILLDHGAHLDAFAADHRSPLAHACRLNKVDMINLLLRRGADIHSVGLKNESALDIAKQSPSMERLLRG